MQEPPPNPSQYELNADDILSEAWNLTLDFNMAMVLPLFMTVVFLGLIGSAFYFFSHIIAICIITPLLLAGLYWFTFLGLCATKISIQLARMEPVTLGNFFSICSQPTWPLVKKFFSALYVDKDSFQASFLTPLSEDGNINTDYGIGYGLSFPLWNFYSYMVAALTVNSTYSVSEINQLAIKALGSQWSKFLEIALMERVISYVLMGIITVWGIIFLVIYMKFKVGIGLLLWGLILPFILIKMFIFYSFVPTIIYRELFDRNFFTMHIVPQSP